RSRLRRLRGGCTHRVRRARPYDRRRAHIGVPQGDDQPARQKRRARGQAPGGRAASLRRLSRHPHVARASAGGDAARGDAHQNGASGVGVAAFAMAGKAAQGAFSVEYKGRSTTTAGAKGLEARAGRYMSETNSRWTVDGSSRSNMGRYANHSCRPNAESDVVKGKVI